VFPRQDPEGRDSPGLPNGRDSRLEGSLSTRKFPAAFQPPRSGGLPKPSAIKKAFPAKQRKERYGRHTGTSKSPLSFSQQPPKAPKDNSKFKKLMILTFRLRSWSLAHQKGPFGD